MEATKAYYEARHKADSERIRQLEAQVVAANKALAEIEVQHEIERRKAGDAMPWHDPLCRYVPKQPYGEPCTCARLAQAREEGSL